MPRDFKFFRRNSGKDQDVEEIENVPINPNDLSSIPALNPKPSVEQVGSVKRKCEWTPVKARGKMLDTATLPVSTPERQGTGNVGRKRLALSSAHECRDEGQSEMANYLSQSVSTRNGSSLNLTPRVGGTAGRAYRGHSDRECASTQNTPARSVSKPPNPGFAPFSSLRHPGSARAGSYAALSRRFSVSSGQLCTVNTVEVPHFDLKEDPSFWMDHNVQVIIRVRPLNSFEINTQGYNRCVKQENAHSITWIGQPETRFTFDHVACETVDQEMLFRMSGLPMVENCLSGYNSCMFAYGQTGSGKTYTMLGEMEDLEFKPSSHRGMTPRIFEFLFARISAEEESRRDERLKYSCKCSFLEIYNEQITDLLDPTSTNLLLREDIKKGVHVENLSEFEVHSVSDVLRLLIQGSSNRKVAATDMNRESSRSHSVFTCVVESKWERDSTTNLRFARLNLVDLAGSERQKSSGAEGERLKEAANINKSLSTLGHVIMLLVDIAQGKPKHVPYRDSRLTFLLQDSLGGNSKTMIIANISPSICCAAETLNTLKFAQRAKLIQNNAVVNEDSSGDVAALQHQIWLLREELSSLKHQNVSRRLAFDPSSTVGDRENTDTEIRSKTDEQKADNLMLKSMEKMLAGALRREQIAEASIKELKAEIEQLNLLVHQREEDTKCTKMMLKFREDKIKRMESLLGGLKPVHAYLLEEIASMSEEIQLLRAKDDKNPEVTRFASENIRLQEQLRRFQDFYEEGERDILMNEISELRSQLIHFFDNNKHQCDSNMDQVSIHNIEGNVSIHSELTDTLKELTECRSKLNSCSDCNAKLSREIEELNALLRNKEMDMNDHHGIVKAVKDTEVPCVVDQVFDAEKCISKHGMATHVEEILNLELELDILKIMLKEERLSHGKMEEMIASLIRDAELAEERVLLVSQQCDDAKRDLKEAKSVIEALESQQLLSINEIEDLKNCNDHYLKLLHKQELEISALKEQTVRSRYSRFRPSELKESPLQVQLKRMQASLDKAKNLNIWYQNDHDAQRSNEEEMDKIRRQAEAETADVIVSLQEELSMLQHRVQESDLKEREAENKLLILESNLKELQETLDTKSQDNEVLHQNLLEKDMEIKSLKEDWEILRSEIEGALLEGNETLGNVCDQVDSFSCPLSDKQVWVSEQMGRVIRDKSEKESIIQELNRCLEDANVRANDMEHMLLSLRGAAIVLTESHEQDCSEKEEEILQLRSELSRKTYAIAELEQRLKLGYDEMMKSSTCATAAFVVVNRLSEINCSHLDALRVMDIQLRELQEMNQKKDGSPFEKSAAFEEAQINIEPLEASCDNCISLRQQLHEQQKYISTLQRRIMENDKCAFAKTKEILEDCETEVSMGRPSMDEHAEHVGYPERNSHGIMFFNGFSGERALQQPSTATEHDIHEVYSSLAVQLGAGASNTVLSGGENGALVAHDSSEVMKICNDSSKNDTSVVLLGNEIGSAVGSLKETQAEIAHPSDEKKEIHLSEGKACEVMEEAVETRMLSLQAAFSEFEKQCESKMLILDHKLHIVEECAQEAKSSWSRRKELHKFELIDAKTTMDQQTAEFSSLLADFEEAQDKIKEADMMINELTVANETMKLETENLKKVNVMLTAERDSLITEVEELQSSYALKDQNYKNLEEQFEWDGSNVTSLVEDVVSGMSEAQGTYEEVLSSIVHDFNSIKSQIQDAVKWMHLSLEEITSEILAKDCALLVSYLCHMGVLLDAIMRLQSENSLLHDGICESDAVISHLRENNMKSKEELQIYQMLNGKLSADIRSNLVCMSSKESETRELSMKLSSFKEKLEILQHQEELMLEKSNIMSSELAVLTEKLDQSNSTVMVSLLEQERLLKINEEETKSQVEIFMLELIAKDFQLLVLVSELQQLAHYNADMEEQIVNCSALDYLMTDVTLRIVADMREQLSSERETEVICLQIEAEEAKDGEAKVLNQLQKLEEEYTTLKEHLNMKEKENESFKNKLQEVESSNCNLLKDIQEKDLESNSLMGCIDMLKLQNCRLEADVSTLESRIALLEKDLKIKKTELDDLSEALCKRSQDLENGAVKVNALQDENLILRGELLYLRQSYCEPLRRSSSKVVKCIDSVETADLQSCSMLEQLDKNIKMFLDKISEDAGQNLDVVSGFLQELEFIDANVKGLVSENLSLQEQLSRKDEVLNGLLFDLRLLRENAANSQDQVDEIEKLAATLKSAEDELAMRSSELDEAVAYGQKLGVKLKEQTDIINTLEMDLEKANHSSKLLSDKNMGLRSYIDIIMAARASVEQELTEKRSVVDGLEKELLEMGNTLGQMNDLVESLNSNLVAVSGEKDQLQKEVMVLEEKLGTAHALAKENEAIASECQEVAESRRIYAEEKEEEVKLLESSVLELGSTITALENKVDILKKEAERQQTKRETLESELHSLKSEMHNIESADDIKRHLDEKAKNLQEALEHLEIVEEDLMKKDREIAQCKTHIAELTVHAEGQASRLRRAETFLLLVMEELVQYRVSSGTSSSITFDEVQRLNKKLKGTEKDKLLLVEKLLALFSDFPKAAGGTSSKSKSNDYAAEEALEQSGVSVDEK